MIHTSALRARADVVSGALRGDTLRSLIASIPFTERDAWVDALLDLDPSPPDAPDLPRGAVPYLACPVDDVLAMMRDVPVGPDDTLVDVGSGLGRVAILAHLVSGARAVGIEIQEELVRVARTRANELGLSDAVSFVRGDASVLAIDGSVVFLYAPCNGEMLERVLDRVEGLARRRSIAVAAVGLELRDRSWLTPRTTESTTLAIYDST